MDGLFWAFILITPWGPLWLQLGYRLPDVEFLVPAAMCLLTGFGLAYLTPALPTVRAAFCAVLAFVFLDTYVMDVVDWVIGAIDLALIGVACWVIRDHVVRILGAGAIAVLAATAATSTPLDPVPFRLSDAATRSDAPPTVIHLVLDEHSGSGGLPADLASDLERARLADTYTALGFQVFTNVSSSSASTQESLTSMMNGVTRFPEAWLDKRAGIYEYAMNQNRYLEKMLARGYTPHVLQSSFLDFCTEGLRESIDCRVYPHNSAGILRYLDLSAAERVLILGSMIDWSMRRGHNSILFETIDRSTLGESLNEWRLVHARWRVQPLVSQRMLAYLEASLSRAGRGELFVAHLLIPHHPYIFSQDCGIKNAEAWVDIHVPSRIETSSIRRERYARYVEQMQCTDVMIAGLIGTISANPALADATIVLHGDHGSRIGSQELLVSDPAYSQADYDADFLTALFAVRRPGIEARVDASPRSLVSLFWESLGFRADKEGETVSPE